MYLLVNHVPVDKQTPLLFYESTNQWEKDIYETLNVSRNSATALRAGLDRSADETLLDLQQKPCRENESARRKKSCAYSKIDATTIMVGWYNYIYMITI